MVETLDRLQVSASAIYAAHDAIELALMDADFIPGDSLMVVSVRAPMAYSGPGSEPKRPLAHAVIRTQQLWVRRGLAWLVLVVRPAEATRTGMVYICWKIEAGSGMARWFGRARQGVTRQGAAWHGFITRGLAG